MTTVSRGSPEQESAVQRVLEVERGRDAAPKMRHGDDIEINAPVGVCEVSPHRESDVHDALDVPEIRGAVKIDYRGVQRVLYGDGANNGLILGRFGVSHRISLAC